MSLRRLARSLGSLVVALGVTFALPATADAASAARQEPPLVIEKTANTPTPFSQGQFVTYTLAVSNSEFATPSGPVIVGDSPAGPGLIIVGLQGTNWACSGSNCTYTGPALDPGAAYPPITVTAEVAETAPSEVCNTGFVGMAGGGTTDEDTVCSPVTQSPPADPAELSIAKSHSGAFSQGGTGTYTLTVSNASGAGPTEGTVTVTDTLPTGVTYNNATGSGWTCSQAAGTVTCTRGDELDPGASYPPITLTVNVTSGAACSFTNSATVSGGGSQSDTASDATTVGGGTCDGGNGGNGGDGGGGSILPVDLSGILPMFNNIAVNNNIDSPGATNTTNQNFAVNGP
ncbi:DUF11 domain-containing protein [Streptomyces sp. NPDC052610]|uniref:DUF11 domain-containing protein n=1 Tax=Streptomyces sp. NPDC052610 TaxID=3154952 RepID=UPI0034416A36